jgi:hypothetical protein
LIEFPDDHQALAALEEIKLKFSQFSHGNDLDPISTSPPCILTFGGLSGLVL